jgi:hypothetical protein
MPAVISRQTAEADGRSRKREQEQEMAGGMKVSRGYCSFHLPLVISHFSFVIAGIALGLLDGPLACNEK